MSNEMIQLLREARKWLPLSHFDVSDITARIDAALALAEAQKSEAEHAQKWLGMDGATAFHLIERHANSWEQIGAEMEAWRAANSQPAAPAIPKPRVPEELLALIRTFRREVAHLQSLLDGAGLTQPAAPAVPADIARDAVEDRIEAAYWNFDARRNGYGRWASAPMSERDAFKAELRNALSQPAAPAVPADEPDILAEYSRTDGHRQWVSVGCWLKPGECIAHITQPAAPESPR